VLRSPSAVTRSCARELELILWLSLVAFASTPTSPQPEPLCSGGQKSILEAERAEKMKYERYDNAVKVVVAVETAIAAVEAGMAARPKAAEQAKTDRRAARGTTSP
jgi:hypothetical protein